MRGRTLALGAILVLMSALGAQAQDDEDEDDYEYYFAKESSGYVEVYGVGGYWFKDGEDAGGGGVGVTVGGHITENFAMDVSYEFSSQSETHMGFYSIKGVMFSESRIQPYGRLGIGVMGGRPDGSFLFMGRAEAGLGIFLDEQLAVRMGVGASLGTQKNYYPFGTVGIAYYFE